MTTSTADEQRALIEAGEAVTNAFIELARRETVLREARRVADEANERFQQGQSSLWEAQHRLLQIVVPESAASVAGNG